MTYRLLFLFRGQERMDSFLKLAMKGKGGKKKAL